MKIFIVGIAGGVGVRVADQLVARGDDVDGLVRRASKGESLACRGISTQVGDLVEMSVEELAAALRGSDAIVFTAGAGESDAREATIQIDGEGPGKLAAAAKVADVRRFVLVSVFPEAWRERHMDEGFELYMTEKKKAEAELVLTELDWVIVRPSALTDNPGTGKVDLGLAKVHVEIPRDDVATTIVEILQQPEINQVILEVTAGTVPIPEAVIAMKP
jgi:nucleoside-diphosphate-sugar epimerase